MYAPEVPLPGVLPAQVQSHEFPAFSRPQTHENKTRPPPLAAPIEASSDSLLARGRYRSKEKEIDVVLQNWVRSAFHNKITRARLWREETNHPNSAPHHPRNRLKIKRFQTTLF
jgi:hypothetical protein